MGFPGRGLSGSGKMAAVLLVGMSAQMFSGCAGFFVYPGSSTTTTTTGSSTADYAFVSNSTSGITSSGSTYINGYSVGSGTLVAASGSPASLGIVPQAMAVTPGNGYLYVAGAVQSSGAQGIYGYSIGTGGALSVLSGGAAQTGDNAASIAISPNGAWLFVLDAAVTGSTSTTITVWSIQSNGTLSRTSNGVTIQTANGGSVVIAPKSIVVAPSGDFLAVALGTGGAEVLALNESTGALGTTAAGINFNSAAVGINAVAIDANNYLYIAGPILSGGVNGIESYLVSASGTLASTYASSASVGTQPVAIEVSANSDYVYVANYTSGTISEFSTTSTGQLTALNSIAAPTGVSSLGHDSTGSYLVALGYNTATGIELYTIGSTGALTETAESGSGGTVGLQAAVIAMSH